MQATPYTLAKWHVRPGMEAAFVDAWRELARSFAALPAPPVWGSLLQSDADSSVFYSFGPWRRPEDIVAMRENAEAHAALQTVRALCVEASPGSYRLVCHVEVGE